MSLRDRMETARKWLDEQGISERAWCRAAGLSETYAKTLRLRLESNPEAGSRKVRDLSRALAELSGGEFAPGWLDSGEGSAPAAPVASSDFPGRVVVLAMAAVMSEKYHPSALEGLRAFPHSGADPGEDFWWATLDRLQGHAERQLGLTIPPNLARALDHQEWPRLVVEHARAVAASGGDRKKGEWIDLMREYAKAHAPELEVDRGRQAAEDAEREPPERSGEVAKGGRRKRGRGSV